MDDWRDQGLAYKPGGVEDTLRYWWLMTKVVLLCGWRKHNPWLLDKEWSRLPDDVWVCWRCGLFTDKDGEPVWVGVEYE
jgi:hypothetical protein